MSWYLWWANTTKYSSLPQSRDDEKNIARWRTCVDSPAEIHSVASRWPLGQVKHIRIASCSSFLTIVNLLILSFVILNSSAFRPVQNTIIPPIALDVNDTRTMFDGYIGDVETYLHSHLNNNADSATFAQMGLFTRLYARLLQDRSTDITSLKAYERSLWFFAPGIDKIRHRHMYDSHTWHKNLGENQSRGIVLPVGKKTFIYANHFIATVRNVYNSQIPIEIIFRDETDLPRHMSTYLTDTFTNIFTTELVKLGIFDNSICDMQGWSIKPFALVASNFSQVMMADADSVLLAPPEMFFEQEDYMSTGTLFFSDRNVPGQQRQDIHDWILRQLGRGGPGPSESLGQSFFWNHASILRQESGVLIVDKRRSSVFASLLFAAWQNIKEVRNKVTNTMFYGDKETFWLAFELARLPYYMNSHGAGSVGAKHHYRSKEYCAEHPLHFFEGHSSSPASTNSSIKSPLDTHKHSLVRPAWMNGSIRNNKNKRDSKEMIDPDMSIWSMDGTWVWSQEPEDAYCLRDYTPHTMDEYGLGMLLSKINHFASEAEKRAQEFIDSSR